MYTNKSIALINRLINLAMITWVRDLSPPICGINITYSFFHVEYNSDRLILWVIFFQTVEVLDMRYLLQAMTLKVRLLADSVTGGQCEL